MSLDALLARLEARTVTPVTDAPITAVTLEPLQMLGCTAVTSVTAENEQARFERNLSLWLAHHPPTQADASICPHCGKPNGEIGRITIATANGIWLHSACHVEWLKQRRQQAIIEMHTNQTKH
jgi:hypothetical protein